MELLLNLVWLLLALPAYCLWRRTRGAHEPGSFNSSQCLLALGCALVVLFPVVSATDDLHAMRAEMEESSKRSIRQAAGEKSSASHRRGYNPSAAATAFAAIIPLNQAWHELCVPQLFRATAPFSIRAGRAPPVFHS